MSSEVSPSSSSSIQSELMRLKSYRDQLQQRNDIEIQDIEAQHANEVEKLSNSTTDNLEQLRKAYEVKISQEAESLEERLHQIRIKNEEKISSEKRTADDQFARVKTSLKQKIDEYKKNADSQIEALHKQFQTTTESLHEQARKSEKREKEAGAK